LHLSMRCVKFETQERRISLPITLQLLRSIELCCVLRDFYFPQPSGLDFTTFSQAVKGLFSLFSFSETKLPMSFLPDIGNSDPLRPQTRKTLLSVVISLLIF